MSNAKILQPILQATSFLALLSASVGFGSDEIEFNRHVRPILSNHCFACHGPDSAKRQSGLRLDRRESATAESDSGLVAITPGDVTASELIRRITADDEYERMPPADGSPALTTQQIEMLSKWIEQGAVYEPHWSFVSPRGPQVPRVADSSWPLNDIDRFVLSKMELAGAKPASEATREALIRRVTFDMTGLPPTLAAIDDFLADQSPDAYLRMVDRALGSSAYGEHMARHWLDLARYADSNGYQYDTERQQWVWRDWVIAAYNANKRFDEFTVEQLAGDLLPDATPQQRLATGFNRNHGITIEGGVIDEEYRVEYVMDRLVTSGEVWLGLTIGCARCHEHKFDPISQKEFYRLFAFFNQVPEKGLQGFAPQERIVSPLPHPRLQELNEELARLQAELAKPVDIEKGLSHWAEQLASAPESGWSLLTPLSASSSGGTTLQILDDHSILAGEANPRTDVYEIVAHTNATNLTAARLEALTHPSLPGGGPGRHSNSNFVLSEFELTAVSLRDPTIKKVIRFDRATADYSQANYEVAKAIDGTVEGNNGWAVDGPVRKKPAAAMFVATEPFGFEGGSELHFVLRHEAGFATHGVGRPRLSVTTDHSEHLKLHGAPSTIRRIARTSSPRRSDDEQRQLRDYFVANYHPSSELRKRIAAIKKQKSELFPPTMVMQDMRSPRETFVFDRGQYNAPLEPVSAGVPGVFPAMPPDAPSNRLGLAQWLVDPSHPLTARVAVNRYWQRLFGVGLVKTSEDFGVQGELPSHPELLDWLAVEFIRSGWNIKHIQRLIVTSATYRQTSHVGNEAYRGDPENRLLARGPRMRLDAEEIRDATLAASGLLVHQLGGKSVFPYQPEGLWLELNNRPGFSQAYPVGDGDDLYRRSLYTFWKRTVPSPMLKTLDAPEREFCTIRRSRTNTPLQALALRHAPQFVEAARHLGERMMTEGGRSIDQRIIYGFRLVTSRKPDDAELQVLRSAYETDLLRYGNDRAAAMKLLTVGDSPSSENVDLGELAAWASLARLLLNLDEAISKG